jgi:hypothetical protein
MVSASEKEDIVNAVVERIYLKLPEIMGNLMAEHAAKLKISKEFYDKYPEFKDYRREVAAIIERVEGTDPTRPIKEIMEKAVPEIRSQLKNLKNLDMKSVSRPNLDFGQGEL